MGYTSEDIATITEPKRVTLAALPNFVQFASKAAVKTFLELNLAVLAPTALNGLIRLTTPSGDVYNFIPTADLDEVTGGVFYLGATASKTAENLRAALMANDWLAANFEVTIPANWAGAAPVNGSVINIKSKGAGADYNIKLTAPVDLVATGKNLFNPNDPAIYRGAYLNTGGGQMEYEAFSITGYIPIAAGQTIYCNEATLEASGFSCHRLYDANKVRLTDFPCSPAARKVTAAQAGYVRFTLQKSTTASLLDVQAEAGAVGTAFETFKGTAYAFTWVNALSVSNDSIAGEAGTVEVELDVYTGPAVFLGANDKPDTPAKLGKFAASLQKTYAGLPVWFDLNALFSRYGAFTRPGGGYGWFNTGTASVYRFIAKIKGAAFYYSNALWAINGYGPLMDTVDLAGYVYRDGFIKLLTNKPRTTYLRGQKEYLNFLFEDPQRDVAQPVNFTLRVAYRAYATGGAYLGTIYAHDVARAALNVVNTCALNLDAVLDAYPTTGEIKVALARGTALVSNDLEYQVRPEGLHTLRPFTFLNRLGGWDTFNFDAPVVDEIKPQSDTFNKTITPGFTRGDSVETVYATALENTLTVEGAPVSDAVADWLKELAAASVVLDAQGNYVVKDDFTLRKTAGAFNMQTPTIKYHLSQTYTND